MELPFNCSQEQSIAAKLFKPLGNPPQNDTKYFAAAEVLEASKDSHWLARGSSELYNHWRKKNASRNETADVALAE